MPTINLGVYDILYALPQPAPKKLPVRPRKKPLKRPIQQRLPLGHHTTTGVVAKILEAKYHIMERLFEKHRDEIMKSIDAEVTGHLHRLVHAGGGPLDLSGAMSEITDFLKQGIAQRELDGFPGIPTKASLRGINHRLLHPYAKGNPVRPSFIDTASYQGAIVSWFDP